MFLSHRRSCREKLWEIPVFLDTKLSRGAFRKFTPRSDWMVAPRNFGIPSIISEVISQKSESDRHRMLVQAIAVARTGQYLLKSTSKRKFFVVAIYVNAKMVASRYIVMQTNPGDAETKPVSDKYSVVYLSYLLNYAGLHLSERFRPCRYRATN